MFDHEMQLEGCPHIFLWEATTCTMERYVAAIARVRVSAIKDSALVQQYSASYLDWKKVHGTSWRNAERNYYESRTRQEQGERESRVRKEEAKREMLRLSLMTPEERHKERLEKMGLSYGGVRALTARRFPRLTHCYACKSALSSFTQSECVMCGWILCNCGACGCGRGDSLDINYENI